MPIGSRLVNRLGSGIGLATEAYHHHKTTQSANQAGHQPVPTSTHETTSSSDESEVDDDEATWALDDASQELAGQPPPYSEIDPAPKYGESQQQPNDKSLGAAFLARHPPQQIRPSPASLPVPVIIPQRRPRDAQRGFVLAYAPLLQDYAGIDQQTFLEFLSTLNKSCEASQAFDVINLGATATMFVPSIIAHMTSRAVTAAATAGQEAQSRAQRNTFLDKVNENFFRPRGLWCMIVTWQPESRETILKNRSLLRSSLSNSNAAPQAGQTHGFTSTFATSSGTTQGNVPITDCAPLIYPAIDAAALSTTPLSAQKQNKLRSSQDLIGTYLDRRRAADFAGRHPNSAVASAPTSTSTSQPYDPGFASRWADPNHPANSGTLLGLVTGGTFDPRARRWGQRAQRRARRHGHELSEEEMRMAEMGRLDRRGRVVEGDGIRGKVNRATGNRKRGVRRMIRQDMCYLMVVAYPDDRAVA